MSSFGDKSIQQAGGKFSSGQIMGMNYSKYILWKMLNLSFEVYLVQSSFLSCSNIHVVAEERPNSDSCSGFDCKAG